MKRVVTENDALQELVAGIAFWRSRPLWPDDFHNGDYETWAAENPDGDFTDDWWFPFLRRLRDWIAIRPASYAEITERFVRRRAALSEAWAVFCRPFRDRDISSVTWEHVAGFPLLVGEIKPMKSAPSTVFVSKFCHFLLPKIFPVVDNEGSGGRWRTYEQYFKQVQMVWAETPEELKTDLIARMNSEVELAGRPVLAAFPTTNKIVELRLIGRHHPLQPARYGLLEG
jgi:hypothetical protein